MIECKKFWQFMINAMVIEAFLYIIQLYTNHWIAPPGLP